MKVRLQRDFKDCGVTCLSYLIAHYGGYVPIEQLREDTDRKSTRLNSSHL